MSHERARVQVEFDRNDTLDTLQWECTLQEVVSLYMTGQLPVPPQLVPPTFDPDTLGVWVYTDEDGAGAIGGPADIYGPVDQPFAIPG